jgi:hypothetical protein
MAEPWTFNIIDPVQQIFTLSNGQVTFTVDTQFVVPPPVTVQSVTLQNHHDTVALGITNVEIPPPVIEHISGHFSGFDLLV